MAGEQIQLTVVLVLASTLPALCDSTSLGQSTSYSPRTSEAGFQPSKFQQILKLHEEMIKQKQSGKVHLASVDKINFYLNVKTPVVGDSESLQTNLDTSSEETTSDIFLSRSPRQSFPKPVPGGVDFSQATRTSDGRLCVIKDEQVETVSKDPILECKHKVVEQCHYTYITYFKPAQEEACEENYEKICQITFKQEAIKETVRKCYRPLQKVCNGQGPQECRTVYESACSTKYIQEGPGKFVGDTKCEKLPVEICGAGCVTEEGPEECHEKTVDSLVDVPEESCDLNPQKTCRLVTKLVPSLKPKQECTTVPQETCNLKFTKPERKQKPLRTEWCLDDSTPSTPTQATFTDIDSVARISGLANQYVGPSK